MLNKSRRRHRKKSVHAELDVTAFMNLMVVLIPFLLITAVFSQVTVIQMNLPAGSNDETKLDEKPPMQLEVIIRTNRLVLAERNTGVISEFPLSKQEENLDKALIKPEPSFFELNQKLQLLKAQASEATTITILAEPDTSYDLIIQTMDAVRLIVPEAGSDELPGELFPDVSIGSAPIDPLLKASKN